MKTRKLNVIAGITLLLVQQAFAPSNVSIGNGIQQSSGTYLNAQKIANNLAITSITIQASGQITIVDPSDLSTSPSGTPKYNLSLVTPTLTVSKNLNMAAESNLLLTVSTINLNAEITSGGTLIDPARVIGTATQVNVLSNTASIQQAIDIAAPATPVTVQVSPGQYPGDLTITNKQVTLLLLLTRTNGEPVIIATNLTIGMDSFPATNSLAINGGIFYFTNAPATGALDVRNGMLAISNVTATVDNLLLTNGALSTLIFSKGTLQVGSTTVSNGQLFVVGDGVDIANYVMQWGTHSFNNGLVITNNSILSGCGTVNGAVTNYGIIYLNHGCDMYFNRQVVNYGKIISAANATPHFTGGLVDYTAPRSFPVLTSDGGIEVAGGEFTFTVAWNTNQVVVVETSSNLQNWIPVQTNTMATPYFQVTIPATNGPAATFFRVN